MVRQNPLGSHPRNTLPLTHENTIFRRYFNMPYGILRYLYHLYILYRIKYETIISLFSCLS